MNALRRITVRIAIALLSATAAFAQSAPRPSAEKSAPTAPVPGRPFRGVVTDLLVNKQLVLIHHEDIPGFLAPMTRAFNVPADVLLTLKSGTRVAATLLDQQPDGWHLVAVRLLVNAGATLAPELPYRVPLTADAGNPGTFSGSFTFVAPTTGDWRANVSTRAAWVDLAPRGGAPLTSKACSHANPPGFLKGPLYALTAGRTYEVRFTKVPAAELDVLLQHFISDAPAAPAQSR